MLNFNTKKEILRSLRAKRNKNKLLWLPCVIAELFVKLWYAVLCSIDMALSDKNGNFLGMKRSIAEKAKSRKKDDIVNVHKPFAARLMSGVLAIAFVFMMIPELGLLDMSVYAAYDTNVYKKLNELVTGEAVGAETGYLFETSEYSKVISSTVTNVSAVFAKGAVKLTWDKPSGLEGVTTNNIYYLIEYTGNNTTESIVNNNSTTAIIEGLSIDAEYTITITPRVKLKTYEQAYSLDVDGNPIPTVDEEDGKQLYYSKGTQIVQSTIRYSLTGRPNGKIIPAVSISSLEYDGGAGEVIIKWKHTSYDNVDGFGLLPYGYAIYRAEVNYSGSNPEKYEMVAVFPADDHVESGTAGASGEAINGSTIFYRDNTIKHGTTYNYYIKAYRNLFGDTSFVENGVGIIDSGDEGTSPKSQVPIPPAKVTEMNVISNGKDTLDVSWKKPRNSNVDGYYLFRSENKYTDTYIDSIKIPDPTDPNNEIRKYWDEKNQSYDYYKFITDMVDARNANELDPDGTEYEDKYNVRDNQLENDKIYYYYLIPYVDADRSGFKKLYGPMTIQSGSIGAILAVPQWSSVTTSDGKVELKWKAVDNASGYRIYIEKTKNYTGSTEGLGDMGYIDAGNATSYTIDGLLNGDQYIYKLKAYTNVASNNTEDPTKLFSDYSAPKTITVGTELGIPQDLVVKTSDGQNEISWKNVTGADGYKLEYRLKDSNDWKVVDVSGGKYTHTRLHNGDIYEYRVRAYKVIENSYDDNNDGKPQIDYSEYSEIVSIMVGDTLDAPKDFMAVPADGVVNLSWSKSDGAEGYILYAYCGSKEYEFDVTKTKFEHTGVLNGEKWNYYLKAYKTVNGERVFSDRTQTASVTVGDFIDSPKDFIAETDDGVVNLSWSKVDGADGYILYAYNGSQYYEIDLTSTKYTHKNIDNGEKWNYYLKAYKVVNGEKVYSSATKTLSVTVGETLNAAVDLFATAGNRQIDLSWSKVTGAEGYIVYLFNEDTQEYEPLTVTSKTTYSHTGLKNGKAYTYMVAPFKTINGKRHYGDYSMAVTAIPTTGSPTDVDRVLNIKGTTPYGISHSEYISAKANHDAFNESVDVYITTNQESTKAVKDVLKNYANGLSSFIIYPFDISVYKENTLIKVDPEDGYTITMTIPIPDKLIAYRDYLTVVHINEDAVEEVDENEWYEIQDQRLEVLPCAILDIDNVWCVQFVCSSFSPYAFVIYKDHLNDVSAGGGVADGLFAGNFNSGMLLLTALPDVMLNNKKLSVVESRKRYRIKKVTRK